MPEGLHVRVADWNLPDDREAVAQIRRTVFIVEQAVPPELEWDGLDEQAIHLLAFLDDQPVGTVRITRSGKIGRMAVLGPWRRSGIASALMDQVVEIASELGLKELILDAQLHAIPFYERHGFVAEDNVFMDADIQHRHMRRRLSPQASGLTAR